MRGGIGLPRRVQRLIGAGTGARLARSVGGAFIVSVLGIIIAFGLQLILARSLGATSYGEYIYVLTTLNFLVFFAKFGFDTATLRFIPEYYSNGNYTLARGFFRWSRLVVLSISTAVAVVAAIGIVAFLPSHSKSLFLVYLAACPLLPLSAYVLLQASKLQAFGRIVLAQSPQVILRPLLLAVAVIAISAGMAEPMSAMLAMILTLVAAIVTVVVISRLIRRHLPREIFVGRAEYRTAYWAKVSLPMLLITGFNLLINQADILMVGALLNTTEAGIYSIAARISMLIPFGVVAINSVTAPMISRLYSQGKIPQLQRMMTAAAWGSLAFAVPVFAVVVLLPRQVMGLFGQEFSGGSSALIILAATRILVALFGSAGYLMSMSGNHNRAATILGCGAAANIVLNFVLIPPYKVGGAAIAALASTAIWSIAMAVYGYRHVGVNVSVFSAETIKFMRLMFYRVASAVRSVR